jgi:uncharacterized integral membrane protein
MKLFKRFIWFFALIVLFYFLLLNVSQTVDIKFFLGESGVLKNASLVVVLFLSVLFGFFLGVFFMLVEVLSLKKQNKLQNEELKILREEVDSHRNIVVNDVLDKTNIVANDTPDKE